MRFISLSLLLLLLAATARLAGASACGDALPAIGGAPPDVWSRLRHEAKMISFSDLTEPENVCSQLCTFHIEQAVALALGLPRSAAPVADFTTLLSEIAEPHRARNTAEVLTLLKARLARQFPNAGLAVHGITLPGTKSPPHEDLREVDKIFAEDVTPTPTSFKMILTAQLDADDNVLYSHAQIARVWEDGKLQLIDGVFRDLDWQVVPGAVWLINDRGHTVEFNYTGTVYPKGIKSILVYAVITVELPLQ